MINSASYINMLGLFFPRFVDVLFKKWHEKLIRLCTKLIFRRQNIAGCFVPFAINPRVFVFDKNSPPKRVSISGLTAADINALLGGQQKCLHFCGWVCAMLAQV